MLGFQPWPLVRHITFPKVPRDKLDSALRLQAGENIALPAEEMVLDYAVLGRPPVLRGGMEICW